MLRLRIGLLRLRIGLLRLRVGWLRLCVGLLRARIGLLTRGRTVRLLRLPVIVLRPGSLILLRLHGGDLRLHRLCAGICGVVQGSLELLHALIAVFRFHRKRFQKNVLFSRWDTRAEAAGRGEIILVHAVDGILRLFPGHGVVKGCRERVNVGVRTLSAMP